MNLQYKTYYFVCIEKVLSLDVIWKYVIYA